MTPWNSNTWARELANRAAPIRHRLFTGLVAGLLWLALGAGCGHLGSGSAAESRTLRIGTVADSPPLAFRDQRQWAGLEIDLGRALAERLGMRPVFVALTPEDRIPALLSGRVDILMAGMPINQENRTRIDFATPYLVTGQSALVRRSDGMKYNTLAKLRRVPARIAVVDGSAADPLVTRYFPRARRMTFPTRAKAAAAIYHAQADVFIHDGPAVWWTAWQYPDTLAAAPVLFAREEIAWGFRPGSVLLRESANRALAEWQRDGTLEAILRRWLPISH